MKKYLIISILLILPSAMFSRNDGMHFAGVHLFDAAPNEELYGDMLLHCDNFIHQTAGSPVSGEVKKFRSKLIKSHKTDRYIWIPQTLEFVRKLQSQYPPRPESPGSEDMDGLIRKNISLLLDFPMHCDDKSKDADPQVINVFSHARDIHMLNTHERLMQWLRLPAPEENEIRVAKVYSSGLLFRTKEHMLALDVRWEGSEDDARLICEKADMFILSHNHNDHYSLNVLERMMLMGKPVVLPGNVFHETRISSVLSSYDGPNKILWDGPIGTRYPLTSIGPAKVEAIMAAQGNEPCLLYMVDLDGWRIAAVGDNSHLDQQYVYSEWEAPDFVCTPIFQGFQDILGRISSAPSYGEHQTYYLPLHENEYHHPVSHRVGYRFLFHHQGALNNSEFEHYVPYVLLDGGESVSFTR